MRYFLVLIAVAIVNFATITAQDDQVGVSSETIQAYPEPAVAPVSVTDLLYDRVYRRVTGDLTFYNAPGGDIVDALGTGFNFVTLSGVQTQGEWTQIGTDLWVATSNLSEDVAISRFAGVLLPEAGLPYTMAWVLVNLYPSEEPGGDPSENNRFIYRYTRVNIYATVQVDGRNWYQIGENQWVHQFHVARILPVQRPETINTEKWVSVDLYEQVLIAYEGNTPVFGTMISSGLQDWETNEGSFNVWLRRERTRMAGAFGQPDFYYLEEVPWTMYFDDDIALHGAYWHDGFGYRRSHGCVNMSITDAHWVFNWSSDVIDPAQEDSPDLSVYVYSSGEYK